MQQTAADHLGPQQIPQPELEADSEEQEQNPDVRDLFECLPGLGGQLQGLAKRVDHEARTQESDHRRQAQRPHQQPQGERDAYADDLEHNRFRLTALSGKRNRLTIPFLPRNIFAIPRNPLQSRGRFVAARHTSPPRDGDFDQFNGSKRMNRNGMITFAALAALGLGLAACEQDTRDDIQEETGEAVEETQEFFEDDSAAEDAAEEAANAAEETGDEMEESLEAMQEDMQQSTTEKMEAMEEEVEEEEAQ